MTSISPGEVLGRPPFTVMPPVGQMSPSLKFSVNTSARALPVKTMLVTLERGTRTVLAFTWVPPAGAPIVRVASKISKRFGATKRSTTFAALAEPLALMVSVPEESVVGMSAATSSLVIVPRP